MPDFLIEHANDLSKIDIPVIVDHMMWLDPDDVKNPGVDVFRRLHERGNWYIKVTNGGRISREEYEFGDVVPLMRTLVEAAPDRVTWGTDWAHTMMRKSRVAADSELLELLYRVVPDEGRLHKILVDNPKSLFEPE